jgi:hypothetical protein
MTRLHEGKSDLPKKNGEKIVVVKRQKPSKIFKNLRKLKNSGTKSVVTLVIGGPVRNELLPDSAM